MDWTEGNFDQDIDVDVDITDFNGLAGNFAPSGYGASATSNTPEPAGILLTALGLLALALLRWRY